MKYIIELEKIEGTNLFKAKGCNTLVFDQNGIDKILKPLEEECHFEKDELVEVSHNKKDWKLRYFSHSLNGMFFTYCDGDKSNDTISVYEWEYCRKYGTLGGLTN